jgi:hypothetical protein
LYNPASPVIYDELTLKFEQLLAAIEMVGLKEFCGDSLISSVGEDSVIRLLVVACNRPLDCWKRVLIFLAEREIAFGLALNGKS